jgi:hypothetical protein
MIRIALQLLAVAASMGAVVAYGFARDRREHKDVRQQSIYFPEHRSADDEHEHRGAAMSSL